MSDRRDLHLALIQTDLVWQDPVVNRAAFEPLLQQARGADLVVLPEMFTTGFPCSPPNWLSPSADRAASGYSIKPGSLTLWWLVA